MAFAIDWRVGSFIHAKFVLAREAGTYAGFSRHRVFKSPVYLILYPFG